MMFEYRAQCLNVVDGDTVDLLVDLGFHDYRKERFRVLGVDTPELRAKEAAVRERAQAARAQVIEWLKPAVANLAVWPLRIRTERDPDSFGRYLAAVWFVGDTGTERELGAALVTAGLAVPYNP